MMEGASPLVLTKICLPVLRQQRVERPRLLTLLDQYSARGFVLVSAPAGYGKTTLLLEWSHSLLSGEETALAWYALDSGDDEILSFGAYLVAALQRALGKLPELERLAATLRSSAEIDLQEMVCSLINIVVSDARDCVLLLDDYHLITRPAIHMALVYLLEHRPANLRLVLGSRADPPFPLARLRAQAAMLELRAAQLRFSEEETRLFLQDVMNLKLEREQAAALAAHTEGWAAGLQLAALSLAGQSGEAPTLSAFSGGRRFMLEYLLEEVVARQSPALQRFLLLTSLLERMCAPLCDALLDVEGESEALLAYLLRSNLFVVALDDEGLWFRYHHLFRDSLQARLSKERLQDIPRLHRTACEWLAQRQYLREAGRHAFAAGDPEYAAAFVERYGFSLLLHSEIAILHEWCAAFSEEVMQRHALLCLLHGWTLVFRYQRRNRERVEERLQQAGRIIDGLPPGEEAAELREHVAVVRTFLSMAPDIHADAQELLHSSQVMLKTYPDGDPARFSALLTSGYAHMASSELTPALEAIRQARAAALKGRLYFGVVESSFHLARLAQMQGHLSQAGELCRETLHEMTRLLPQGESLPAAGCLKIALGCVLLEQYHPDEALEALREGLQLAGRGTNPFYLLTAHTALARLYEMRGEFEAAITELAQLEERWPDIGFCAQALRLQMALRAHPGDASLRAQAHGWRQRNAWLDLDELPLPGMGPFGAAEAFYRARWAWMRILLSTGEAQTALDLLRPALRHYEKRGMVARVIELNVLGALLLQACGDTARAADLLQRALLLGQAGAFVGGFAGNTELSPLLQSVAVESAGASYAAHLRAVLQDLPAVAAPFVPAGDEFSPPVEALSERELQVLQWMAQGATNQAIASALFITVGTVKSHVNHILRKLQAGNRTEAVARARRLRLPGL